jgi:predicted enzyme related to lactoylglutathione lyase
MHKQPNQIDYIEFPAKSISDLNQTRDFFKTAFGWSHAMYGDDYADTSDSGVYSGINAESPSAAPLVIIYSANLTESLEKVKDAGGKITKEIYQFPGGSRFNFCEPSGIEMAVWSDK